MNRRLFSALISVVLCFHLIGGGSAAAQVVLNGAGSTFPAPLYAQWFAAYSKVDPEVQFNYQAVGSGKGQKLILDQEVDFGASDAPINNEALANASGKILHVPTVGGADVITFNVHNLNELRLDGPTLAAIYLGKVNRWNDQAIAKQNPGIRLPDMDITVAHRLDASGTTYIFTDYLSTVSSEWKLKVGRYISVNWPVGVGLVGSSGVSKYVKKTPGAIGYVELLFAIQDQSTMASIKNSAGVYIKASTASITAALSTAPVPDDFRISLVNAPGPASYPIAGLTWILVYQAPGSAVKPEKLIGFLKWALTDGQKMAPALNYAPLPESLRRRVVSAINPLSPGPERAAAVRR
jgi:phosphate transport system substrate-binding protein